MILLIIAFIILATFATLASLSLDDERVYMSKIARVSSGCHGNLLLDGLLYIF